MTIDYNFSLSQTIKSPKNLEDNTVWAIKPDKRVEFIAKETVMLFIPNRQNMQLLQSNMLPVLDMLTVFKPMSQHVKDISKAMNVPTSEQPQVVKLLNQLRDADFLWSSDDVLALLEAGEHDFTTSPPLVVVRTAGRVEMFKRFLLSAVENEVRYFGRYHYIIIDDSEAHQAEANLMNLKNSELNFTHFDKSKRDNILQSLKHEFSKEADDLDFLLGSHALHNNEKAYGRSWNWGMLLTAGHSSVFLDDDSMVLAFEPPISSDTETIVSSQNKSVYFLHKNLPLGEQLKTAKLDPIARLGGALGQSLSGIEVKPNTLNGVINYDLANINKNSTAVMTSQAVAGDTGSDSLFWLYNLDKDSTQRLMGEDEETYKQKKRERFMWTGYPTTKVSFSDNFSQVARGIDNRQLVPAAIPVGRNEDSVFTTMIHAMYPHRFSLDFPWAITHLPEIERAWRDDQFDEAASFNLNAAFRAELAGFRSSSVNLEARFAQIISHLQQRFSTADFDAFMFTHQQESRASLLRLAHEQLEKHANGAEWWKRDIERMLNANIPTQVSLVQPSQSNLQELSLKFIDSQSSWAKVWHYAKSQREKWFI